MLDIIPYITKKRNIPTFIKQNVCHMDVLPTCSWYDEGVCTIPHWSNNLNHSHYYRQIDS